MLRAANQLVRRASVASAYLAIALIALPTLAQGATVSVSETRGDVNRAELTFVAAPGEQNQTTISRQVQLLGDLDEMKITDPGAALTPGPGCSGGGPVGAPMTCVVHSPRGPDYETCGHSCFVPVKGTEWTASVIVELGDGGDSLDAGSLPGRFSDAYTVKASGGEGADSITSASANDTIDPGSGNDVVHAGDGHDTALASTTVDGDDLYDLGVDSADKVSYAARTMPIKLENAVAESIGESDSLAGVEYVAGGSADDVLIAAGTIDGEGGNDLLVGGNDAQWGDYLIGGPGNDVMRGNDGNDELVGGDGDDLYEAGNGRDLLFERTRRMPGDGLSMIFALDEVSSGQDVANGGTGDDLIELGPGMDRAEGDEGDDSIYGEADPDELDGGRGEDVVAGEGGADSMLGGPGSDVLLAGHTDDHPYSSKPRAVDGWHDSVDCGEGEDGARANRWDLVRNCEGIKRIRAVHRRDVKRNRRAGTATLSLKVVGPGTLDLIGGGASRIETISRTVRTRNTQTIVVPVRPLGSTRQALQERGHAWLSLQVTYLLPDGIRRTESFRLRLVERS